MAIIEAIATTYLEADAASVTFSSIPATYEHLQLRVSERADGPNGSIRMQFNDDTASNYAYHRMRGTGSTVSTGVSSPNSFIYLIGATTSDEAPFYGGNIIDILDYANSNKATTIQAVVGTRLTQSSPFVTFNSGLWTSTAAVTKIKIYEYNGWKRGSSFTLYGLNSA